MQKQKYKIPKNLCQLCYETGGRYILDCYCIICQQCYARHPPKGSMCNLCGRPTKGNKIDAKQESSIKKIGHLFDNVDAGMQKLLQIHKFQNQIANRYCQYLQKQLAQYQSAVGELIAINPNLYNFFSSRVKLRKNSKKTQPNIDRNNHNHRQFSTKGETTVKPNRDYASEIFESRRSTLDMNPASSYAGHAQLNGVRPIGRPTHNNSGNIIYKVPNINYNTAVRSSKRITRGHDKIAPDYDEDLDYYKYRRQ